MALSQDRPGYAQVGAASHLTPDDPGWMQFIKSVLRMPPSVLPAVRYAVKMIRTHLQGRRENSQREARTGSGSHQAHGKRDRPYWP